MLRKDLEKPLIPTTVTSDQEIHIDITQPKQHIRVEDRRDADNVDYLNQVMGECCEKACMHCTKCLRAFATCCEAFGKEAIKALGELYPLLIRPIMEDGVGQFFRGRDGQLRLQQPFADALMFAGNPLLTVADAVLPINTKGGFGFPLLSIIGRFGNFCQLLNDARNPNLPTSVRIKNPLSAVTAASMAVYFGMLAMSFANSLLAGEETILDTFSFNPAEIIQSLLKNDSTGLDKFIIAVAGYIGATNAFIKGKNVLDDTHDWWNQLWAESRKDRLFRHYEAIAHIDPAAKKQLEQTYRDQITTGKDWKFMDVIGRGVIGGIASIPARLFQQPSMIAEKITLPREWWGNNNRVQGALVMGKERLQNNASHCIKSIRAFFGYATASNQPQQDANAAPLPYKQQLEKRKLEFWSVAPKSIYHSSVNYLYRNPTLYRNSRVLDDIQANYSRDIVQKNLGLPLTPPVMAKDHIHPARDANWANKAKDHPEIQAMLQGNFKEGEPFAQSMERYQQIKYEFYNGLECKPSAPPLEDEKATHTASSMKHK